MMEPLSILIVDDEASVCDALEILLGDAGHLVESASTGRAGIDKSNGRRFDLTITDVNLPDMSGLDLIAEIRKNDPAVAVIAITAHCTPQLIADSERLSVLAVLSKPFTPADVLKLIEGMLTVGPSSDA